MKPAVDKLKELGIHLPLFPTTSVGSFPKPDTIKKARAKREKGEISAKDLRQLEEKATREWIDFQEKIGVDVLVDGEMYRGDMVAYFSEELKGFSGGSFVR
ncbi:MAG: 5-methyltetrahydropteroyltriglutamate--homocysteine S-methyltransferase, partial [Deltaproteobacteria bacterium]|nr:5-methyltetrahydropteroyltriglutamate--homocysteine S-methyltransferase [Deltaproteobacteria bacterium]